MTELAQSAATSKATRWAAVLPACAWPVLVVSGASLQHTGTLVLALALAFGTLTGWVLLAPARRYVFGLFVAAFMLFLGSRFLIDAVWPGPDRRDSRVLLSTPDIETHVLVCLNLALLGLLIGAQGLETFVRRQDQRPGGHTASPGAQQAERATWAVRQVGFALLALTFPARLWELYEVTRFVQVEDFYDLYTGFTSTLPVPVVILAGFFDVAVIALLATRPSRRLAMLPLGLYLVEGIVSLATLQRASIFLNLLLIAVYLIYRHTTREPGEGPWLRAGVVAAAAVLLPVLMIVSQVLVRERGRFASQSEGLLAQGREFFYAQGVSANVVAFTEQFGDAIPDNRFYSVGPIIEFVRYRIIGTLTGEVAPRGNTVERALEGNLFSHTVSYLSIPDVYLRGSGYGSSFVAELYVDAGYVGVLVGSVVIGSVTILLTRLLGWGLLWRLVGLLMIRQLFFIPRGSASGFLVNAFDLHNIIGLTLLGAGTWLLTSHAARSPTATAPS